MARNNQAMDDIFDDEVEENEIARKEWHRTENDVKKTGYRLGLSAGQEETLQQGFDEGYAQSVRMGYAIGRLQGQISASLTLVEAGVCKESGGGQDGQLVGQLRELVCKESGGGQDGQLVGQLRELLNDCSHVQQSIMNLDRRSSAPGPAVDSDPSSPASFSPSHAQPVNFACAADSALGEITERLSAVGLQNLPPLTYSLFGQRLLELLQRYDMLRQQMNFGL